MIIPPHHLALALRACRPRRFRIWRISQVVGPNLGLGFRCASGVDKEAVMEVYLYERTRYDISEKGKRSERIGRKARDPPRCESPRSFGGSGRIARLPDNGRNFIREPIQSDGLPFILRAGFRTRFRRENMAGLRCSQASRVFPEVFTGFEAGSKEGAG